ncbi:MAG: OmpH family outer membrane protein [Candidatus Omnitrophica bacterium]|nr:OmpH family outer membrane protein [Candidatus Omnitrophota bacterium]
MMTVILLTACGTLAPPSHADAREDGLKMGYVDIAKLFDDYKRTQEADADLEQEGQAKQKERDKVVQEVRRLKDELELLAQDNRQGKQQDIDAKIKELQEFDRKAREELRSRRDNLVKDILTEIQAVIDSYGKSKGYDIIFHGRALVYSSGEVDVTNEILTILNDQYQRRVQ